MSSSRGVGVVIGGGEEALTVAILILERGGLCNHLHLNGETLSGGKNTTTSDSVDHFNSSVWYWSSVVVISHHSLGCGGGVVGLAWSSSFEGERSIVEHVFWSVGCSLIKGGKIWGAFYLPHDA